MIYYLVLGILFLQTSGMFYLNTTLLIFKVLSSDFIIGELLLILIRHHGILPSVVTCLYAVPSSSL